MIIIIQVAPTHMNLIGTKALYSMNFFNSYKSILYYIDI